MEHSGTTGKHAGAVARKKAGRESVRPGFSMVRPGGEARSGQKKIPAARYSPTGNPRSTLAEETLHYRVRNGNGCCLLSMATGKPDESGR